MYTHCTKVIQEKDTKIHYFQTYQQLASIVGSTLKAPEHMHDDLAVAFALAQCARILMMGGEGVMNTAPIQGRSFSRTDDPARIRRPVKIERGVRNVRTVRVVRSSTRIASASSQIIH
jgi:hypothetical protein